MNALYDQYCRTLSPGSAHVFTQLMKKAEGCENRMGKRLLDFTEEELFDCLIELKPKSKLSNRTNVSNLRKLFCWANENGITQNNPVLNIIPDDVWAVARELAEPPYFSCRQMQAYLDRLMGEAVLLNRAYYGAFFLAVYEGVYRLDDKFLLLDGLRLSDMKGDRIVNPLLGTEKKYRDSWPDYSGRRRP